MRVHVRLILTVLAGATLFAQASAAAPIGADKVPSAADAGRIAPRNAPPPAPETAPAIAAPAAPLVHAPAASKSVSFVLQGVTPNWSLFAAASGQVASGPLYSSEQFGYGGQAFGRAYDASEITGDHAVAASLGMRYSGIDPMHGVRLMPYGFYDMGRV